MKIVPHPQRSSISTICKKVRGSKQVKDGVYKFIRRYYNKENLHSLKKTITTAAPVDSGDRASCRYAFLQYIFTEGEQTVALKRHAGSKVNNKPYTRTRKSTLDKIKKDVFKHDPKKIMHNIIAERGGIDNVRSGSEIPRNRKQLYNIIQSTTCTEKNSDPLQYLMQKCKEEIQDDSTALIRSVQVTPEPIIFLATKQQLKDIERFLHRSRNVLYSWSRCNI